MDICSLPVAGQTLVYACAGTSSNPPALFVHGWGATHKFWRHVLPAFSLRYRCLAPDLPGFGLSTKPAMDYSIPSLAQWVGKIADAFGLESFDLVGHSMGGLISTCFALENPHRVKRLCVINPPLRGSEAFFPFAKFAMVGGVRMLMYLGTKIGWMRRWVAKDFTYVMRLEKEIVDDVARGNRFSMIQTVLSMHGMDVVPRLRELAMPALLIGTDKDRVIRPEQQKYWPHRYEEIRETGHIPMLERPDEFNRVLAGFLS